MSGLRFKTLIHRLVYGGLPRLRYGLVAVLPAQLWVLGPVREEEFPGLPKVVSSAGCRGLYISEYHRESCRIRKDGWRWFSHVSGGGILCDRRRRLGSALMPDGPGNCGRDGQRSAPVSKIGKEVDKILVEAIKPRLSLTGSPMAGEPSIRRQ